MLGSLAPKGFARLVPHRGLQSLHVSPSSPRAVLSLVFRASRQIHLGSWSAQGFHRGCSVGLRATSASGHLFARGLSQKVFSDPNRPDLYYHVLPSDKEGAKPTYALSFLPELPAQKDSATIIGWLPPDAPAHNAFQGFIQNDKFRALLQQAVKSVIEEDADEIWHNGAIQLQQGWMHIFDQRNIPDLGRIPDVDDIIGTVLVKDSKIVPETYFPLQYHRLCTADGVVQLTPGIAARLQKILREVAEQESKA